MKLPIPLLACCIAACSAPRPPAPRPMTATAPAPDDDLLQIDAFFVDPDHADAAPLVSQLAERRDVEVRIPEELIPELLADPAIDERTQGLLLVGFVAANARPQIARGEKGDRFADGMRGVLRVYEALGISVRELDEVRAQDQRGALEDWARAWSDRHRP